MSDLELVELMERYNELKSEYDDFLVSDYCARVVKSGCNTPTFYEWVKIYKED